MKKNKKLMIALICIISLFWACVYFYRESNEIYIAKQIHIKLPAVSDITYKDNHRGFHGDGETFGKIEFNAGKGEKINSQIAKNESWNKLPLTKNLNIIMYGGEKNNVEYTDKFAQRLGIPRIKNGYWFFLDRSTKSNSPKDDTDLLSRSSLNFTLSLYDVDTKTLYYLEFDT